MKLFKRLLCIFFPHERTNTYYKGNGIWHIECKHCGYIFEYKSPGIRLVGTELQFGFSGK